MARMLIRQIYLEWSTVDGHILKGGRNLEIRADGSKTQNLGNNISSVITYQRAGLWQRHCSSNIIILKQNMVSQAKLHFRGKGNKISECRSLAFGKYGFYSATKHKMQSLSNGLLRSASLFPRYINFFEFLNKCLLP